MCADCRHQFSVIAQTILHNTKMALTVWFWAAYLLTADKRGISALLLQRQLGLRRCETAWMMLHKFCRAMVNPERERCMARSGRDLNWRDSSRTARKWATEGRNAAPVLGTVAKRGRSTGRARMAVIPDFKSTALLGFSKQIVVAGSTVYTDGLKALPGWR